MKSLVVHIMGAEWTLDFCAPDEDERLEDNDGYTDWSERRMCVLNPKPDNQSVKNLNEYRKKVTRHEIIHAFLYECGFSECSGKSDAWAMNEEMVNWLAHKGPQIVAAWKEANAL